eukprot:195847_1
MFTDNCNNFQINLEDAIHQCVTLEEESKWMVHCHVCFDKNDKIDHNQIIFHGKGLNTKYLNTRERSAMIFSFAMNNKSLHNLSRKQAFKMLSDEDICSMLIHYGLYKFIVILAHKSKDFTYEYTYSIGALQQYSKFLNICSRDIWEPNTKILLPLISNIDIDIHKTSLYNNIIFKKFIYYYIYVTSLSIIHCQPRAVHTCPRFRMDGVCDDCLCHDLEKEAYLGYMMLFCAKNIRSVLCSISNVKLKEMINECYNQNTDNFENKHVSAVHMKFKLLKKWAITEFINSGRKHIFFAFNYYLTMNTKDPNCFPLIEQSELFFIVANALVAISGQHKNAKICYILSIISKGGLYEQVMYLRALSKHCYAQKEYFIGYKILKCAFKLSKGYILPSFVNMKYKLKRKKFRKKRNKMKCFHCNKAAIKLNSCKGCMKAVYCGKQCQKKHWNITHRNECDRSWISSTCYFYDLLKRTFDWI